MKREMFWSDDANGEVRYENSRILHDCTPSQARDIARRLNEVVEKACGEVRPIEKVRKQIGRMSKNESRLVLLLRYALMYVLDHES